MNFDIGDVRHLLWCGSLESVEENSSDYRTKSYPATLQGLIAHDYAVHTFGGWCEKSPVLLNKLQLFADRLLEGSLYA